MTVCGSSQTTLTKRAFENVTENVRPVRAPLILICDDTKRSWAAWDFFWPVILA